MQGGPGIAYATQAGGSYAQGARVWTRTGRDLVVMVVVLHVLHFAGVRGGPRRRCVVSSAQGHIQVARGTRHVSSGGHAHRARAVEPLHAGRVEGA